MVIEQKSKTNGNLSIEKYSTILVCTIEYHVDEIMQNISVYKHHSGMFICKNKRYISLEAVIKNMFPKLLTSSFPRVVHSEFRGVLANILNARLRTDIPFEHVSVWEEAFAKYWERALDANFKYSRFNLK